MMTSIDLATVPGWLSANVQSSLAFTFVKIAFIIISFLYAVGFITLHFTHDPNEPPLALTAIPFIGPVIGMAKKKINFYPDLIERYRFPILTLRVPGFRLYVISATSLIPKVQKQWQTLSFAPIQVSFAKTFIDASKEGIEIVSQDLIGEGGFMSGLMKTIHSALSPGPELDAMNQKSIEIITGLLDKAALIDSANVNLDQWVQDQLFPVTTNCIFGPENPLQDPSLKEVWFKYEKNLMLLMLNVFPNILAREGVAARAALVEAFQQYFKNGGHKQGSGFIRRSYDFMRSLGLSLTDTTKYQVSSVYGFTSNTLPTAFWFIYRLYSDPEVLEDCRAEVSKSVKVIDDVHTIDFAVIRSSCPIFLSTFRETLRFYGSGPTICKAIDDHLLDGQHLIKKDSMVFIPSSVQHRSRQAWGEDSHEFSHKRFCQSPGGKRLNMVAFRAFGGGVTLCPGRHFATTEILLFAAMMLLRFDIVPKGSDGWTRVTSDKSTQYAATDHPDFDIPVTLTPRNRHKWDAVLSDTVKAANLTAEDQY